LIKFLIWDKYWKNVGNTNTDVHNLQSVFIDFQAAFDTVWRKEIWSEMHKLDPPSKKKVHLCTILNNEIHAKLLHIYPLNLKLTKIWDKEMQLRL
jgi:hypothetical protein